MYWILDLVTAVLLLLIAVLAAKRGFIRTVYRFAALIAAVFIALTFSSPAAAFLEDKFIHSAVYGAVHDSVDGTVAPIAEKVSAFSPKALAEDLPEGFRTAAKLLGADIDGLTDKIPSTMDDPEAISQKLSGAIADPIAHTLYRILGFAAVFLAAYLLLRLFGSLLGKLFRLPVLRGIDRFLGFLLGLGEAAAVGVLLSRLLISLCGAYALSHPGFPLPDPAGNTVVIAFFARLF